MKLGPDTPYEGDFAIDLRPGTDVNVYSMTVVGYNGAAGLAVVYIRVRIHRRPDGTIEGAMVGYDEGTWPGWATLPVVDSTSTGCAVTFTPSGAVWRTALRTDLIAKL